MLAALIGTLVSAFFLFAIAIGIFICAALDLSGAFVRVRRGEPYVEEDFDLLLGNRGFLSRFVQADVQNDYPTAGICTAGECRLDLGFNTATEIGSTGRFQRQKRREVCRCIRELLVFPVTFCGGNVF